MKNKILIWLVKNFGHFPRYATILLVLFTHLYSNVSIAQSEQNVKPIVIQIAYIYNFMKFVNWPDEFMPDEDEPYKLCPVIRNVENSAFDSIAKKQVTGHPISVEFKTPDDDFSQCHLVFISGLNNERNRQIISKMKSQPTLTVGTASRFLESGGMIEFDVSLGQVTFSVNYKAVTRSNISISANMLDVAERVIR